MREKIRTLFATAVLAMVSLMAYSASSGSEDIRLNFPGSDVLASEAMEISYPDIESIGSGSDSKVFISYQKLDNPSEARVVFKSFHYSDGKPVPDNTYSPSAGSGTAQRMPSMDADDDIVLLVFLDSTWEIDPTARYLLRSAVSADNGTTWSVTNITTYDGSNYPNNKMGYPDVCISGNGTLYAVWTESGKTMISFSEDLGANWSSPEKVKEHTNPQMISYGQFNPSVACNDEYVVVAWSADPDYKRWVFHTSANVTDLSSPLVFTEPTLFPEYTYPQPLSFDPILETDDSGTIHVVWWDYKTDDNGYPGDNPKVKDRPSIFYSRSTDGGYTFDVGGNRSLIVNTSIPDGWHSPADMDVRSDGMIAVTWYDYTRGIDDPNVFTSVSADGRNWSGPYKASGYWPDLDKWDPQVSIDEGGYVYTIWNERKDDNTGNYQLRISRSVPGIDPPPQAVKNIQAISVGKYDANITWDLNREPDFKEYFIVLTGTDGFDNTTINYYHITDQGTNRYGLNGLQPNWSYNVIMVVVDESDQWSKETFFNFKTDILNFPPCFTKKVNTLYVDEDSSNPEALNISEWFSKGWIVDDNYKGQTSTMGLLYEVESMSDTPRIRATVREIPADPPSYVLDLRTDENNWVGEEEFRIKAIDAGEDWSFNTPDDQIGYSNWFNVSVNPINDPPVWYAFRDEGTGIFIPLKAKQTYLDLSEHTLGAIEDREYRFKMESVDADRDLIRYGCDDPRVSVEFYQAETSIFAITPDNDDVPLINLTITSDDGNGGGRSMEIVIPVINMNDLPYFTQVDSVSVLPTGDSVSFSVSEGDDVGFLVMGDDIDAGDVLSLSSESDRFRSEALGNNTWNVTIATREGDNSSSPLKVVLVLKDKAADKAYLDIVINVADLQKQPAWGSDDISFFAIYDTQDRNEWESPSTENARPEWNEPVKFNAKATDPDGDRLTYTWRIYDEEGNLVATLHGEEALYSFPLPRDDIRYTDRGTFRINLTVEDGFTDPIYMERMLTVFSDPDNDNDGLPDEREFRYFGSLIYGKDDDPDNDGKTNDFEIGFNVPDDLVTDPMDPDNGAPDDVDDDDTDEGGIPGWIIVTVLIVVVILLAGLIGMFAVYKVSSNREELDEEDIERRVEEMDRRQRELEGLYGKVNFDGTDFGPDQSTLSDLRIDLGGSIYHGMRSPGSEGASPHGGEVTGGPLFEESDEGPLFTASLELFREKLGEE
jgi:hypothetical protein